MTVDDELLDITNKWRSKKLEKCRSKKLEMLLLNKISTNCYALFRLIYLVPGKLDHINSPRSYYILVVLFWINAMDRYISRIIWHSIFYLQYSVAWDWTDALKKLLSTTAQLRRSVLNDCVKFNIFASVHAMKTEIPPFDSERKDSTNSSL
jgi:hypothetical protein